MAKTMSHLTYTLDELRKELQERSNYTARKFITHLEAKHGFPRPLPHKKLLWSKPAVDHWFESWDMRPDITMSGSKDAITILTNDMEQAYG
jgi:hypothetical protein